jgi:hypothetical protein
VDWEGRPEDCWEERENGELVRAGRDRDEGTARHEVGKGTLCADHTQQNEPGIVVGQEETQGEPATSSAVVHTTAEEIASRYPGVELPPKWRAVAGGDLRFLEILYKLKSMPLKPVQKGKWPPSTREELSRLVV